MSLHIAAQIAARIAAFAVCLFAGATLPALADTGRSYRQKAEAQMDYIQAHFYEAKSGRYHGESPDKPGGLPYSFMWENGVQIRALVDAAHYDSAKYTPVLNTFADALQKYYWDPVGPNPGFNAYCSGPGGDDKYYDDNAWLVLGFEEAYQQTKDPKFLKWANETQRFVLSGWDNKLGGGLYWSLKHKSKNTCVTAPASVGALRLSLLDEPDQRVWGTRLRDWTNTTLQDKTDGLYWDNIGLNGSVEKTKWTYNTALMIESDLVMHEITKDPKQLSAAERLADASLKQWQDPDTGRFQNDAKFTHLLCESLIQLYQVDHNIAYLNAVRRNAAFATHHVYDAAGGGYWGDWGAKEHKPDERKNLLENASVARLFWMLAPYPDSGELLQRGVALAGQGRDAQAEPLLRQAADSDTEAVEARYRLWKVLSRQKKTAAAAAQQAILVKKSQDPALKKRLETIGWKAPVGMIDIYTTSPILIK